MAQAAITVLHDANVVDSITTANSGSLTVTSTTAGNFVAVVCYNSNYSSLVSISGASDAAGDVFTLAPNSTSTAVSNNNATMAIYYTNSISAGQTSITCNFGTTGTYTVEIYEWEFSGVTNPTYDIGNAVNNSSSGTTTINGPTLATTGTTEWGVSAVSTTNNITQNPKTGNAWISGGGAGMINSNQNAATGLIATSPGSTTPVWLDATTNVHYNSSAASWYVGSGNYSIIHGHSTIHGLSTIH